MGWLSDIGNAVSSGVGAVGDAVESGVNAVTDTVEDLVDSVVDGAQGGLEWANGWLCQNAGTVGCWAGNIGLGGLSGLLGGLQDAFGKGLNFIRTLGGAAGALLRGDLAGFLGKLGELFVAAGEFFFVVVRFLTGGYIIGGIVDAFERDALRRFVEELLDEKFQNEPDRLARIRKHIGLEGVGWGLPFEATHRVYRLDSANAPLWEWHQNGSIDLYAMASLLSFASFQVLRPPTVVRSVSSDGVFESTIPINRWTLSRYINSKGTEGRIRVYAMSRATIKDNLQVASDKSKKLGVELSWNDGERFAWFRRYAWHDISTQTEYQPRRRTLGDYLINEGLRTGTTGEQCHLLAFGVFTFVKGLGQASGRDIREGARATPCATPDRNDSCCVTVDLTEGSGAFYRDQWPPQVFRYVLAHEIGHYLGLCHYGHDGFQNVMFTPAEEADLSYWDWGLFNYYLDSEPHFTLDDAKNVWRFLVDQLPYCLEQFAPPVPAPDIPVVL